MSIVLILLVDLIMLLIMRTMMYVLNIYISLLIVDMAWKMHLVIINILVAIENITLELTLMALIFIWLLSFFRVSWNICKRIFLKFFRIWNILNFWIKFFVVLSYWEVFFQITLNLGIFRSFLYRFQRAKLTIFRKYEVVSKTLRCIFLFEIFL